MPGSRGMTVRMIVLGLAIGIGWLIAARPGGAGETVDFTGHTMGTTYTVRVRDAGVDAGRRALIDSLIDARLTEVNRLMSTYDPASEVSRLNGHRDTSAFAVSPPTLAVLRAAASVSERSGGVFDVTVGPIVDIWGFGPERQRDDPADVEVANLRRHVGFDRLRFDSATSTVRKTDPEVMVDLSAIAKGFGVDRVADGLAELGVEHYLVEVGGEVRGRGSRADGSPWRLGVEEPLVERREVYRVIPLHDVGVATSGDYRNFGERHGRRVAHIVDPRTGYPVEFIGRSVTVVHAQTMIADAWATALIVLPPSEAEALAEREGVAALFLRSAEDERVIAMETSRFREYAELGAVEVDSGGR